MMKSKQFIEMLKKAEASKTLYILGCFGAPMNDNNKQRYTNNYDYNKKPERKAMIMAASADTFGFDCVCLIKGILWGWNADASKVYGGAGYACNGVPDIGADTIITRCNPSTTDFSQIKPGWLVWMTGHVGIYVGDGKVIECTPKWSNNVQYSNLGNLGYKTGNYRMWSKCGKLPYVDYSDQDATPKKTNEQLAYEVWHGMWGSGAERKRRLTEAGYDYAAVQALVNAGVGKNDVAPTIDELAETKAKLKAAEEKLAKIKEIVG